MDIFSNIDLLSVGVAVAANIILGFVVFVRDTKNATNRLFLAQTIILSVWSLLNYFTYQVTDLTIALWIERLVMFFAVPNSIVFALLMHTFPEKKLRISRRLLREVVFLGAVTMFLTLTPFVFSGVQIIPGVPTPQPVAQFGMLFFALVAVLSIPMGVYFLVSKYYRADVHEKKQQRYLLVGVILMFGLIITFNFIFPAVLRDTRFIPLSALFTFPFVALTFYSIYKHGLWSIKVVSTEILTFVLAIVTFIEIIFAVDVYAILFRASVFVLVLSFGVLLIRSVHREVESREKIEKQEKELEVINAKLNETNTQLGVANERLRELDKQKSEFVSMASHQLRSPLTAIKGYASLILDGDYGVVTDDLKHAVKIIFDSAQTLATVVSDYLNVTRIELGKMKYDLTNFDLRDLVVAVTEELRPNVEKAGLKLDFTCDTSRHYNVNADKEKLKQVLMNLIDNSVKYTPKGSVHVSLEQKPGRQVGAGTALFAVKDTGIGIHKDVIPKLFGKFSRADNIHTRDIRGTGLGLYIAKQIVEAHQGKIWAESEGEEKGSQFYLELPMVG